MTQTLGTATLGKELRDVARAVVAHDGFGFDPEGAEVSQGGVEEVDRAVLAFIGHDPGESDPGSIIDGDMDILEAGASDQIAAVTGDAVTGPLDPSEFLDVEVDELAWVLAFITADRRRWLEQGQTVEMMATEEA
jgi:hypothetical protein